MMTTSTNKKTVYRYNRDILKKELLIIFNENEYEKEKFLPNLLRYFGDNEKVPEGINLGYELAFYDTYKSLPSIVTTMTTLHFKDKILSLLHSNQFRIE